MSVPPNQTSRTVLVCTCSTIPEHAAEFHCAKVLERLGLYERRIEQGLYRTLDELEKVRRLRCAEPPAELPAEPEPQPEMPAEEPSCETNPIPQTQSGRTSTSLRHEVAGDGRLGLRDGLGCT